jgi:hypothetical protein
MMKKITPLGLTLTCFIVIFGANAVALAENPAPPTAQRFQWMPPLEDVARDGKFLEAADVSICTEKKCRLIMNFGVDFVLRSAAISADGKYAYIWYENGLHEEQMVLFDVHKNRHRSVRLFSRPAAPWIRFTRYGTIVLSESCGSNCSFVALWSASKGQILSGNYEHQMFDPELTVSASYSCVTETDCYFSVNSLRSGAVIRSSRVAADCQSLPLHISWNGGFFYLGLDPDGGGKCGVRLKG